MRAGRAARAGLAGVLAAGAVLLALGGPARGGENEGGAGDRRAALGVAGTAAPRGDIAAGRALFVRMGCGSCHQLAAAAGIGQVGPDLDVVLPNYDAKMLARRSPIRTPRVPAGRSSRCRRSAPG